MTDYFLHVDIIVKEANAEAFEDKTSEFLIQSGFQRISPQFQGVLALALKTSRPFVFTGYNTYQGADVQSNDQVRLGPGEQCRRYVHLWQLPNLTDLDLGAVMTQAADDALYRALDALVVDESQHYVGRAPNTSSLLGPSKGSSFVRLTQLFKTPDLGPYIFGLGTVAPILRGLRPPAVPSWSSLGAFQSVTGELNSVVEFWRSEQVGVTFGDRFGLLSPSVRDGLLAFMPTPIAQRVEPLVLTRYSPPLTDGSKGGGG